MHNKESSCKLDHCVFYSYSSRLAYPRRSPGGGYLAPNGKDFNALLFNKVLNDTQDQAKFARKILGSGYAEPSSYDGTVELANAQVNYHAEHGKISWLIQGNLGIRGTFDALNYIHGVEGSLHISNGSIHPESVPLGIGITIIIIGITCGLLSVIATNNCQRACGENGVESMSTTCGHSNSSAGCVCKPNPQNPPTPPSPPYPAGPNDTGPYFDGYSYYDNGCYDITPDACIGNFVNSGSSFIDRDSLRANALGQGWMRP